MKKIIQLVLLLSITAGFSQQIDVGFHRAYGKAVRQEQLGKTRKLDDLVSFYPHDWIEQYISTKVSVDRSGKNQSVAGKDDRLNREQLQVLSTAAIGDRITVYVDYRRTNPVTGQPENQTLSYAYTVVPDQEAQHTMQEQTLKKEFVQPFALTLPNLKEGTAVARVRFMVLENGQVSDVLMEQSSGNINSDKAILETVRSMPKWKPAQNKDGRTFRQEFVLVVNNAGC